MHRLRFRSIIAAATVLVHPLVASSRALAQTGAAEPVTGPYISLVKLGLLLLVYLLWIKTTDWINQDSQLVRQNHNLWNGITFFPFVVLGAIGVLIVPMFLVAALVLFLAWIGPLVAYIIVRNKAVASHQRVLTPEHLRYLYATASQRMGMKVDTKKKAAWEQGAAVELVARGGADKGADQAHLLLSRQSPGYVFVKDFIASMYDRRVDAAILDFTADAVEVREQIDGIWRADSALDRDRGDLMLAVMKQLSALSPDERRKPQAGKFGAVYQKHKLNCFLATAGTKTGERTSVKLDHEKPRFDSLAELGMRESLIPPLVRILGGDQGLILFSTPPGDGLTTLMDVAMLETDRLLRHFVAVEDKFKPERYIENLEITTYDKAKGESPLTVLPKLLRTYPDVVIVRDLDDGPVAELLCKQVDEKRLIMTCIRAKSAPEAMLRVLALKVPRPLFAAAISCVVNARLVRKLCTECRVAFEPTAEMLKKLGLPKDKVQAMYREPKPDERDKPCPHCDGAGYIGRTGMYQILIVNDAVRNALIKEPRMEAVNKAARAAQMRTLQEEGILLVAKGVTSLQEVMRVLK